LLLFARTNHEEWHLIESMALVITSTRLIITADILQTSAL